MMSDLRIRIPEPEGREMVVTRGFGGVLFVFTREHFQAFSELLRDFFRDTGDEEMLKAAKTLSRFFMAGACNVQVENGTIEVPETLAEFAGFKRGKDAVVKRREDAEISPDAGTLRSRLTECADYLVCAAGAADE